MKRIARKRRPAEPPGYGDRSKKSSVRRSGKGERLNLMYRQMSAKLEMGKKLSSAEVRRLEKLEKDHDRQEYNAKLCKLLERVPVLKDVKKELGNNDLFKKMIKALLNELDSAISSGFHSAPNYGASSGNSGRGDTWECAPGTHGISCPCTGPHIPGPSGLY